MGWILRKNGDPLAANNKVGLDVDWYRASECVGFMDFLSEYPSHTPEICNLKCPACGKSGGISAKGWNNGATTCYDLASSFPCVVKRYRCTRCSEASNKHEKETDFTVMDVCGQFDRKQETALITEGDAPTQAKKLHHHQRRRRR